MICIIGVGLYLSIRMGFIQIRKFAYAMKVTIGRIFRKREASDGALTPFQAVCTALAATVGTGNIGAGEVDRVKKGIKLSIFYTCIWCTLAMIASYTIGGWLVHLVTGSSNYAVIKNATDYLKFDSIFYYVTAVICIVRNAMQGLGEHITPLVSSSLEMIGKIIIAATLVPVMGYTGVILAEPIVWFIMVIPLLIKIYRMPVLKESH